jgi:hypothetical protein
MERATGKAERLPQIESLLLAYPDGLTRAEIQPEPGCCFWRGTRR